MHPISKIILDMLIVLTVGLSATPLPAQVSEERNKPADPASSDASPELNVSQVEAALAALEADSGIEDTTKGLLRPIYKQALEALRQAETNRAQAEAYRDAIQTGAAKVSDLREQLRALPAAETAGQITASGSTEELQQELNSRQAALDERNNSLSKITAELTRVRGRPVEISSRLPEAQRELADVETQLNRAKISEDASSPGRVADRTLLEARLAELLSELEMLQQEQSSQSIREELLQANQDLLDRQVLNASAELDALQTQLRRRLTSEAQRIGSLANEILQDVPKDDRAAQSLAAEVQALAADYETVVAQLQRVLAARDEVKSRRQRLTEEYENTNRELESGGAGAATAQVMFGLHRQLEDRGSLALTPYTPEMTLAQTRLAELQVQRQLRGQFDVERQFDDHPSDSVARGVAARREVLEKLRTAYGNLIHARAALESEQTQYQDKTREVQNWITKQLFWLRDTSPISWATVTDTPGGLRWAFSPQHGVELADALRWTVRQMPVISSLVVLVAAGLLLLRPALVTALKRSGREIRRISTDRYSHTVKALLWTVLLAAPVPLLIGFAAWALGRFPESSGWMRSVAFGLSIAAWIACAAAFLYQTCRPGGLGAAHFGWPEDSSAQFRRLLIVFATVYLPALLITASTVYSEASRYLPGLGRISFIAAHLATALVLWRMFHFSGGIFAAFLREHPDQILVRCRYLWFPLLVLWPLALVILASWGYLMTAIGLSLGILATLATIAGGVIFYRLALRWFIIRKRRLALQEALEKRRARQQAAAAEEEREEAEEVVTVDPEDEEGMDLESIDEQTRHLLRLLCALGVAIAVWLIWSEKIPLFEILDEIAVPLVGGRTLLNLLQAVAIAIVTYLAVRNLPGLIELALRVRGYEPGTRYAVSTLCQYAITAIGIVLLFEVLDVDWSKFGWIAAGLSVGIGFGLQEVVANFVCGLILLFERPIRLGDIITIEGTTGTVTKIRMRATTITNWDREELVVPNKTLITSTLLNLTLSSPLNRVLVPVGIAYGSDTQLARQILLDVAEEHPGVLDDPAPIATFDQFAESSLNLVLRAYLPDRDNRLSTITDLHTEISKRFAAAGIEIAFPQQDLHIRSGWGASGAAVAPPGSQPSR